MKLFAEITLFPSKSTNGLLMDSKFVSDRGNNVNLITHCHYDTIDWITFDATTSTQHDKNYFDALLSL